MDGIKKTLYYSILERYVKIVWAHKIQEKQADRYLKKASRVKHHISCFTVLTTGGALSAVFPFLPCISYNGQTIDIINSVTALFAMVLSYFSLRYGDGVLETKAKENKKSAAVLRNLRNKYDSLLSDIFADILTIDQIIERRQLLENEEDELNLLPLAHTTPRAVKEASKSLKVDKESTTENEEIDSIVPKHLRLH